MATLLPHKPCRPSTYNIQTISSMIRRVVTLLNNFQRFFQLSASTVVENTNPRYLQSLVARHDAIAQEEHIKQQKLIVQRALLRTQADRDLFDLDQEWETRRYTQSPMTEDEYEDKREKLELAKKNETLREKGFL